MDCKLSFETLGGHLGAPEVDGSIEEVIRSSYNSDRKPTNAIDNDEKFKTDLSFFQGRSLKILEEIKLKFQKQKEKDPSRPYGFDVPWLHSTVDYMMAELKLRTKLYRGEKGLYWRPKERVVRFIYTILGREQKLLEQRSSLEAELKLLNLQLNDLTRLSHESELPYDLLVKHSFWFTRIMQMTEHKKRAPIRMYPYEIFMKSDYGPALEELADYENNHMEFYADRFVLNGHKVFGPNLEVVVLPVVGPLEGRDFLQLRNTPMYMAGVTSKFLKADGFVLPSHTLLLHDLYFHGSKMYKNDLKYFQEKNFSESDIEVFRQEQQKWIDKLLANASQVRNPYLREAVMQATLTIIHDRGKVFAPSTFNGQNARNLYYVMKGEIFIASFGQLNKKLGNDIREVLKNMDSAIDWLNVFWSQYSGSPY